MELTLPSLLPGRLLLLILPHAVHRNLTHTLIARLALAGDVCVPEGRNAFDAFHLARLIRRQTARLDETLDRVHLARAFTCYQLLALLTETPPTDSPCFILNLLTTFYDENISQPESERLLRLGLAHVMRLRARAPEKIRRPRGVGFPAGSGGGRNPHRPTAYHSAHPTSPFSIKQAAFIRRIAPPGVLMGRTLATANQIILTEEQAFAAFRRALRKEDQAAFDALFARARLHTPAISQASHALPFETILLAMLVELWKEVEHLQASTPREHPDRRFYEGEGYDESTP